MTKASRIYNFLRLHISHFNKKTVQKPLYRLILRI